MVRKVRAMAVAGASQPGDANQRLQMVEVDLLVDAIFQAYGHDFRDYSRASLTRRLLKAVEDEKVGTLSGLQERILHDSACMDRVLNVLSVHVTSMFRDPSFYRKLRTDVLPYLETYPHIRIWVAGCATGEEVYSLAILLQEANLLERTRLYATDVNPAVLDKAREGIFPLQAVRKYTQNYIDSGGTQDFSGYYSARYGHAKMSKSLHRGVLFSSHNLVTDASFNEFHLILCRNVMIYFNLELQARVHGLLFESLRRLGTLCLGRGEVLRGSPHEGAFDVISASERIFQRIR
jgi:chemotaxis protein methyltransferase CheR